MSLSKLFKLSESVSLFIKERVVLTSLSKAKCTKILYQALYNVLIKVIAIKTGLCNKTGICMIPSLLEFSGEKESAG